MSVIIVDLDNCIADDTWRRHLINFDLEDPYAPYHKGIPKDKPANLHILDTEHDIVICTGRPERYRLVTEKWLWHHEIFVRKVLMRPEYDYRPAPELKWSLVFRYQVELEHSRELIEHAYDDLESVVEQYRRMGLKATRLFINERSVYDSCRNPR